MGGGNVVIGQHPLDTFTDGELAAWCRECCDGYRPNRNSLTLWVGALRHIDDVGPPVTVRQVFYGLESAGLVEKSEAGYRRVQRVLLMLRRQGAMPYDFVADNTRWMRKPTTWQGLDAYLEEGARGYRRALWAQQPAYVEIWCEKDALAGIIAEVTRPWDVPLMVSRGFASESYLYEASEALKAQRKPCFVYYLGDYDKKGVEISQTIERRLRKMGATFRFERVAIQPEQIQEWRLPTRPPNATDARHGWKGRCVDLDALPANLLRELVEACILRHLDRDAHNATLRAEELERQTLKQVREMVLVQKSGAAGAAEAATAS
jgi:hypothetical protein